MVEPPRHARRGRVLEVDDRILVGLLEPALVIKSACTMHEPLVLERVGRADALAMKAREQRRRAGSVKTFVVVEDAAVQTIRTSVELTSLQHRRKNRTICRLPPYDAASVKNLGQRRAMNEPTRTTGPSDPHHLRRRVPTERPLRRPARTSAVLETSALSCDSAHAGDAVLHRRSPRR